MRLLISVTILLSTILADTAYACYSIMDSGLELIEVQQESENETKEEQEQETEEKLIQNNSQSALSFTFSIDYHILNAISSKAIDKIVKDIPYPPPE